MTGFSTLILAYLIGSIPVGYLLVKFTTGRDVRTVGSGNTGATNVLRSTGRAIAVATLALDLAKAYVAVWLAAELTRPSSIWPYLAALAVMAGHAFPVFLEFKGGKAVATFIGAFLYLTPLPMAAALVVFVIAVAATRTISAGSVLAAAVFPLGVWMILHPGPEILLIALIAGGFVVYRHRSNLERLHSGSENVFVWSATGRHGLASDRERLPRRSVMTHLLGRRR